MKKLVVLVILLGSNLIFAQTCKLKAPNIPLLKEASLKENFKGNILHLFLEQNYQGTAQLPESSNVFEYWTYGNDIIYMQVDSPLEGVLERIAIPCDNRQEITKWVEAMNKFYGEKDENVWNFDQTTYAPVNMVGGGIFKITWEMDSVYIDRIATGC